MIKKLEMHEIVELNGRIYRVEDSAWDNGSRQGRRAILKLLDVKELTKYVIGDIKEVLI